MNETIFSIVKLLNEGMLPMRLMEEYGYRPEEVFVATKIVSYFKAPLVV